MVRPIYKAAGLELRRDGKRPVIAGSFPYNSLATIADRGRVRKERIAPGAFNWTLENEDREVSLLFGHDFDKPLASRRNGSLELVATDDGLTFTASIAPDLEEVTHVRDALTLLGAGLVSGISPGFRVPPAEAAGETERLDPEPGNPGVFIRTILALVLYEISLVTRPAYEDAQAELRAFQTPHPVQPHRIILP
ncbi:HK97 family phage prohead protease [Tateyamaria sp. SN6-1]|uniref:HK97 family phage prohead protease n=1 Tax=Tateyamaria sp. SN6-1 TaxID=3092148 RepID=UPI0039F575D4